MSEYAAKLNMSSCKNIYDIIEWCHETLPNQWKQFPWKHPELNRGIDLLYSDESLNCYMSAYGDMHTSKCRAAMMNFPFEELNGAIEIVDWGCGQGIGSAVVIDFLQQREKINWLKKITLIEPSSHALQRAVCNITKIVGNNVELEAINKYIPSTVAPQGETLSSIGYKYPNIIHVFSNILDVRAVDLATVARMVASSYGKTFVLCIGPKNGAAYRIEQFCSVFGEQNYFSRIDSACYGHTKRTGHPFTCFTRCFVYNGKSLDMSRLSMYKDSGLEIYNEYDLRLQIQNKVFSAQKARVAYRLQNLLSIDDILYLNPIVNEVKVDFIIVRPNRGILLINVFEKDLNSCNLTEGNREILFKNNDKEETYQSPIELMNSCQASIKDGIEELLMSTIENNKNFGLIKKVVIFTENNTDEARSFFNSQSEHINYTYIYGNEFILKKELSQHLYDTINFTNISPSFDDVVIRKLAKIISPSWHSFQEGKSGIEPKGAQKELVISRCTQQKISGVAGSGKTHVLAARAINAMKRTGGNVLILTYNITLANYLRLRLSDIREDFSWEKIEIYPYHQFFRIRASECHLHVEFSSYDEVTFFENSESHKRYSAIFVDEVQDYTTEWLRILINNFLEPNGEFVVFGDPKQNIYDRPIDKQGNIKLGVISGDWNRSLATGRRFTNPRLAALANDFQSTFLSESSLENIKMKTDNDSSINFQIVTYYNIKKSYTLESLVLKLIEIIANSNYESKDFVVLASSSKLLQEIDYEYRKIKKEETEVAFVKKELVEKLKQIHNVSDEHPVNWKYKRDYDSLGRARKQLFTTDKRFLKLSTIKSFKGWESPAVIVILCDDYNAKTATYMPMQPATVYTAITRARESLYIINIGNETFDDFFNKYSL